MFTFFCPIQSTLNSPSRELVFTGIVGIIDRYFILVIKAGAGSVTLLLLLIYNSVSRTKCFKLSSQLPKRNGYEILIVGASNINFLLDTRIVANYQFTYLIFKAMVNYYLCCFIQIVSNTIITPLIKSCLFMGKRFYTLSIFERLKIGILLE